MINRHRMMSFYRFMALRQERFAIFSDRVSRKRYLHVMIFLSLFLVVLQSICMQCSFFHQAHADWHWPSDQQPRPVRRQASTSSSPWPIEKIDSLDRPQCNSFATFRPHKPLTRLLVLGSNICQYQSSIFAATNKTYPSLLLQRCLVDHEFFQFWFFFSWNF